MPDCKLRGVVPPVVVPDTPDHELDVPSFERLINHMVDAGVDGLFFLGLFGEVVFSTDGRRDQVVREAVRIVDGRVPVLVGIIDTETERAPRRVTKRPRRPSGVLGSRSARSWARCATCSTRQPSSCRARS